MLKNIFRRVPVASDGKLIGIISVKDVLNSVLQLRQEPRVLTGQEYKFIVNFVDGIDRDILVWLGNTGLRKSEFAAMRWGDIPTDLKYIRVHGKGDKTRVVPLNTTCKEILLKYKRLGDDKPLQIAARYPGPENCSWLCRRISRKTGIYQWCIRIIVIDRRTAVELNLEDSYAHAKAR